ncbi:MAG: amidohydrolase [Dokdonella sp.]|uniref:amidohydrolase n=1 Tax=Dokdonella sp. TaxID=2291710 RepID=UPI002C0A3A9F|nr:amidohydrolase [Dokdonella sp.]HOX72317.1 amidohydrolase [Dokdonella sp.]HPG94483.1 amidohydrolase [Dokdonella sp.]HPN78978.1 amidohydrolase [Dokdonella sp.]
MRRNLLATALCLCFATPATFAAETSVESMVDARLAHITAVRRDLHEHPELSNRETRTAKRIAAELKKLGYEVHTGIAHTGVVGVLKGGKPGPKLAIRADIDALPVTEEVDLPFASRARGEYLGKQVGVMHACGHDVHMATTLGVASALAAQRKDLAGSVMMIFQPAEEGAPPGEEGGAELMVKEGLFKDFKPDAIFGMHVTAAYPVGTVAVRPGGIMASSDTFRMVVHGRQTHGATPWRGIDPIVAAADIVMSAQSIVSRRLDLNKEPAVLTFGIFDGGQRFNIVPDTASLQGTIRTFDAGMRDQALAELRNLAEHVAAAHGATIDMQVPVVPGSNPVNYNDPALTARVTASMKKVLGDDAVLEAQRWTASEDFPHLGIGAPAPSVYFFVGGTPQGVDTQTAAYNHSPRFFVDEGALRTATEAMLQASLDFLGYTGQ